MDDGDVFPLACCFGFRGGEELAVFVVGGFWHGCVGDLDVGVWWCFCIWDYFFVFFLSALCWRI